MTIELLQPIAEYFAAERSAENVARLFAEDAVVIDDGTTYSGLAAIIKWRTESSTKYTYTVDPVASTTSDDTTTVTARLVGNFPGSPVELRYAFQLGDTKITSLTISA